MSPTAQQTSCVSLQWYEHLQSAMGTQYVDRIHIQLLLSFLHFPIWLSTVRIIYLLKIVLLHLDLTVNYFPKIARQIQSQVQKCINVLHVKHPKCLDYNLYIVLLLQDSLKFAQ